MHSEINSNSSFELTSVQRVIWTDQKFLPEQPVFITAQAVFIAGRLDFPTFVQALTTVINEADGLRLQFDESLGAPRQCAVPVALDLPRLDFTNEKNPEAAARRWMDEALTIPISWDRAPLLRFALLDIGANTTIWFQKFHHLIIDDTGRNILTRRTANLYTKLINNDATWVQEAEKSVRSASADDAVYRSSPRYAADRAYWLKRFAELPEPLVGIDRTRTARATSGRPTRISTNLRRSHFDALALAARSVEATPFKAIVALTAIAFSRFFGVSDICLGLALAHRTGAHAKQSIGAYAINLPFRIGITPGTTLAEAIHAVSQELGRDYAHSRFPFTDLAAELQLSRRGQAGLFDVVVNYIPGDQNVCFGSMPATVENLSHGFGAPWLLTITEKGAEHDLDVALDYDHGLISAEDASHLLKIFQILFTHVAPELDCPVGQLRILDPPEEAELRRLAVGLKAEMPPDATVTGLCAEQAARTPDAIAVVCGTEQISYSDLHRQAEILARRLVALGAGPDILIAIALPRTIDLVVAMLAVLKAGAAYVPFDPTYPPERIAYIVADAAAKVILTVSTLAPLFVSATATLILLDEKDHRASREDVLLPIVRPDNLMYVLYTSGSTGNPKPVGIEHRNVVNLLHGCRSLIAPIDLNGILFSTSISFDISIFEVFFPLIFGGRIILVENLLSLPLAPACNEVRVINTSPSVFDAHLRTNGLPPGATTVILAGEILHRRLADRLFGVMPDIRLINLYGPTETTVYCSGCQIFQTDCDEPSIGRPMLNTEFHVFDANLQLLPRGVTGELFIGGNCVGRGYLGRPELTAERFLPNPFAKGQLYRTGDMVRWRSDGNLDFLGRADRQVKLNGLRVELGEIESNIAAHPDIAATAVNLWRPQDDNEHLVAYMVPRPGADITTKSIQSWLQQRVPSYMVPGRYVWLEAMPVTPNGKLDRKALPPPANDAHPLIDAEVRNSLEIELAAIWQIVFDRDYVAPNEDFFDLGGDSLAAITMFIEIERRLNVKLTADVLVGGLNIRRLTDFLLGQAKRPSRNIFVPLQPQGNRAPLYLFHDVSGDVLCYYRLARSLGKDRPVIGIRAEDMEIPEGTKISLESVAATYVGQILQHQSKGPFLLGGYSLGGHIAYEAGCQLKARGHSVSLLVLMDTRNRFTEITVKTFSSAVLNILLNFPAWVRDILAKQGLKETWRSLMRRASRFLSREIDDFTSAMNLKNYAAWQLPTILAYLERLHNYRPKQFPGRVTVFRARAQSTFAFQEDDSLNWRRIASDGADVYVIPGSHASILIEPNVQTCVQILRSVLEQSEA